MKPGAARRSSIRQKLGEERKIKELSEPVAEVSAKKREKYAENEEGKEGPTIGNKTQEDEELKASALQKEFLEEGSQISAGHNFFDTEIQVDTVHEEAPNSESPGSSAIKDKASFQSSIMNLQEGSAKVTKHDPIQLKQIEQSICDDQSQ